MALGERGAHGDVDARPRPKPADVGGVDLGAAGLDVVEVAPRHHVDVPEAGFGGEVADLRGGVGGDGGHRRTWCRPGRREPAYPTERPALGQRASPASRRRARWSGLGRPASIVTVTDTHRRDPRPDALRGAPLAEVRRAVADVEGWLTDDQVARLHAAAGRPRPAAASSRSGRSGAGRRSCWPSAAADGAEIVAIDPHAGNDRGPQEIDGLRRPRRPTTTRCSRPTSWRPACATGSRITGCSPTRPTARVDDPIDVLFIDGAHRFAPGPGRHPRLGRPGRARRPDAHPRLVQLRRRDAGDPRRAGLSSGRGATTAGPGRWPSTGGRRSAPVERAANAAAPARPARRGSSATSSSRC